MRDFNEVQDESERLGWQSNPSTTSIFNDFISHLDLVDIPLGSPHFTWSDKWGSKFSKLDRLLVTEDIMHYFPHLTGLGLEKRFSITVLFFCWSIGWIMVLPHFGYCILDF